MALKAGDIEDVIRFIRKDISENETALIDREPRFHREIRTCRINQEEVDRLGELRERVSNEEFMKALETSYSKGFISAYEVNDLLNQKIPGTD